MLTLSQGHFSFSYCLCPSKEAGGTPEAGRGQNQGSSPKGIFHTIWHYTEQNGVTAWGGEGGEGPLLRDRQGMSQWAVSNWIVHFIYYCYVVVVVVIIMSILLNCPYFNPPFFHIFPSRFSLSSHCREWGKQIAVWWLAACQVKPEHWHKIFVCGYRPRIFRNTATMAVHLGAPRQLELEIKTSPYAVSSLPVSIASCLYKMLKKLEIVREISIISSFFKHALREWPCRPSPMKCQIMLNDFPTVMKTGCRLHKRGLTE